MFCIGVQMLLQFFLLALPALFPAEVSYVIVDLIALLGIHGFDIAEAAGAGGLLAHRIIQKIVQRDLKGLR